MKNASKIQLSPLETELVNNSDWILTKNAIIQKVKLLLEDLADQQQELLLPFKEKLPEEILAPASKISKGENYQGLPYLVLDHPRFFSRQDIFTIRNLFWWGNFFSTTLHLSGKYKTIYEQRVINSFDRLVDGKFFICINDDPWEHHFDGDNYTGIDSLNAGAFADVVRKHAFIKISRKIALNEWPQAVQSLRENFRLFIHILAD